MDILDKARDALGGVEGALAGLPGIKGYKDKELRREADKRVRQLIAQKLADQRSRLDGIQGELLSGGGLLLLDDVEKVGKKLQLLADRIRTASYGYAPLFDAIKIKEAHLAALAEFDESLMAGVARVKVGVDRIQEAVGQAEHEIKDAIRLLGNTVDELNISFSHRDEVILQADPAAFEAEQEASEAAAETATEADDDKGGLLDRFRKDD